jgi:hypothetical protein
MIRKMLIVGAAVVMPLATMGVLASAGTATAAKAAPPTVITTTCTFGSNVNFQSPGLSQHGQFTSTKGTSTSSTSGGAFSSCNGQFLSFGTNGTTSGSLPNNNLVSKDTTCTGTDTPVVGCQKKPVKLYNYDSTAGFAGSGAATIAKALKKPVLTIEGVTLSGKTTHVSEVVCNGTDVGFALTGTVKASSPGKIAANFQVVACLASDTAADAPGTTGGGSSGNFLTDLGGNTPANGGVADDNLIISGATIGGVGTSGDATGLPLSTVTISSAPIALPDYYTVVG